MACGAPHLYSQYFEYLYAQQKGLFPVLRAAPGGVSGVCCRAGNWQKAPAEFPFLLASFSSQCRTISNFHGSSRTVSALLGGSGWATGRPLAVLGGRLCCRTAAGKDRSGSRAAGGRGLLSGLRPLFPRHNWQNRTHGGGSTFCSFLPDLWPLSVRSPLPEGCLILFPQRVRIVCCWMQGFLPCVLLYLL